MGEKVLSLLFAILLVTIFFSGCTEVNTNGTDENQTEEQKLLGTWYDTSFSRQFTFYEDKTVVYKYYIKHAVIGEDGSKYVVQPLLYYQWELENSNLHITDSINDKTGFTEFSEDRMKIYSPQKDSELNCFKVDLEKTFPIEIKEFSLNPEEIISGQNSKLKWSVTNTTSLIITDSEGNELQNSESLYYKDSSGNLDVTSNIDKSFILKVTNFYLEEIREIDLSVTEFIPEFKIEDNIGDIWQNKLVDDQWAYVLYQESDKDYLDIVDISHTITTKTTESSDDDTPDISIGLVDSPFIEPVDYGLFTTTSESESSTITLTMTLNDNIKSSLRVIYNMYIECNGKTYMGYYSNGVGSWSITSGEFGVHTEDLGWLSNAISGNTFTVSFNFEHPEYYYTIWGKSYEIGGFGDMSKNEWWGDYAPDSYAPWES